MSVYVDSSKQMYVNDAGNSRIMAYCLNNEQGSMVAGTGVLGSLAKQLNYPFALGFDSSMNLYVMDTGNYRLQKFVRS